MSFFVAVGESGVKRCALWNILHSFRIKSRCEYEAVERVQTLATEKNHPLLLTVDDNISLSLQVGGRW